MKTKRPSPRAGDRVFHCGHLDTISGHFFEVPGEPLKLRRPDDSVVEGSWIVLCTACFTRNDPMRQVRGDALWEGDHPVRYEENN